MILNKLSEKTMNFFKQILSRVKIPRAFIEVITLFGFLASTSNCPCCGQKACPVGFAGIALLSGIIICLKNLKSKFLGKLKLNIARVFGKKQNLKTKTIENIK